MKEFLSQIGVPYTLKNVSDDPEALREFLGMGIPLPPVTVINGQAVAGYNPGRILELLGLEADDKWLL